MWLGSGPRLTVACGLSLSSTWCVAEWLDDGGQHGKVAPDGSLVLVCGQCWGPFWATGDILVETPAR